MSFEEAENLDAFDATFLGECLGVGVIGTTVRKRANAMIYVLVEDDGYWYRRASFNARWLDELIEKLTLARKLLRSK